MVKTTRNHLEDELDDINRELNNLTPTPPERQEKLNNRKDQIHARLHSASMQVEGTKLEGNLEVELKEIVYELNTNPSMDSRRKETLNTRRQLLLAYLGRAEVKSSADIFHEITDKLAKLLVVKEKSYGQSFNLVGDVLRLMAPDGIKPEQYDDVLTVVRITEKLFRVMKGAEDEESQYQDIAGYSILKLVKEYKTLNQTDENKGE